MGITSDKDLIAEAGRRLAVAAPDAKVILFGSHARGEARSDSDLDLLVIEPEIESRRAEFVRLREALGNLEISDEIVGFHAQQAVEKWLKALMASLGLPQQRTHDIDQLGRVLRSRASIYPSLARGSPS